MNAAELLELAERCERATGPDRELDLRIAKCRLVNPVPLAASPNYSVDEGEHGWAGGIGWMLPRYTASLDAAMTLVGEPEAPFVWTVLIDFGGLCRARVSDAMRVQVQCDGVTPALALCAAALRARASTIGESA